MIPCGDFGVCHSLTFLCGRCRFVLRRLCNEQFDNSIRCAGQKVKVFVVIEHFENDGDIFRARLFACAAFERKTLERFNAQFGTGLDKFDNLFVAPYIGETPVYEFDADKIIFAAAFCGLSNDLDFLDYLVEIFHIYSP